MGCSCAGEITTSEGNIITEIQTQWDTWYENIANFDMEVGAGLEALAGSWTACCNTKSAAAISIATLPYTPVQVGTDVNGNPIFTLPITADANAQNNATNAWANQMADWIEAYKDWQTTQQLIAVGQLAVYFTAITDLLDQYKDFQECANTEQANLKSIRAMISGVAGPALSSYDAHVTEAEGSNPVSWGDIGASIGEAMNINTEFKQYQSEACFGYEKIQKDHIQNMGTHLAQLCTNARDISNGLTAQLQFLDNTWNAGGQWAAYEDCIMNGPDSLAQFLCDAKDAGEELNNYNEECARSITECFVNGGSGDFIETIKPALMSTIACMQDADGVLENLKTQVAKANTCLDEAKAVFNNMYADKEAPGGPSDKVLGIANDLFCSDVGSTLLTDCTNYLEDCVIGNKEILERYLGTNAGNMSSGEFCLGRAIIDQACGLVNDLQDAVTFLSEHKEQCIEDYEANYQTKEGQLAMALLTLACEMSECVTASHTWFTSQQEALEACWAEGYGAEKDFAAQALVEATLLNESHSVNLQCLMDCAEEAKTCYTTAYLADEKATAALIHDNAQELAPCLPEVHTWLCDQADKNRDRYCEFWQPKEDEYVCAVLDKAIMLACQSEECLEAWCNELDDKWQWWMDCFQDAEKNTIPKLIDAAIDACEKNLSLYGTGCERSDELYDKWNNEWCPCDITDLQYHCDIWNKVNMLEEICDVNECIRTTAETLKDCYQDMLSCEKDYLQEICNMSYDPKYCDMEARAVAHVRKQYDEQAETLDECVPPWCRAAYFDRVADLRDQQVRAESLAIQISDRWEWLRDVHEADRKHNYLQDIIRNFGEQWISNSHEMYRSVQQGNDLLLRHVHDRILRGRLYLESSFGHLDRTMSAVANTVNNGISAVRESHFWPQWYNQGRDSYVRNSINYLNTGNDMMRIGQNLYQQASSDKINAGRVAQEAVNSGLATIDRGHAVKNRAIDAATRADAIVQRTDAHASDLIGRGHELHRQATDNQQRALSAAIESTQQGLATIDRGHAVKRMALDAADRQAGNATAGIQQGIASIREGHFWAEMANRNVSTKMDGFNDAWRSMVQHLQHGQRYIDLAARWGDVANAGVRNQVSQSDSGLSNALAWFNTGQRKLETSLNFHDGHIQEALRLYQLGLGRMNNVLQAQGSMQREIRNSTDGMINMAREGNSFLKAGAESTLRAAALKKSVMECVCNMIRQRYIDVQGAEINLGSSIMGSSYNASQNALGQLNGLLNGVNASLQQLAGPPPSMPLGAGLDFGNSNASTFSNFSSGDTAGQNFLGGLF